MASPGRLRSRCGIYDRPWTQEDGNRFEGRSWRSRPEWLFWLPSRTITHTSVVTGVFNDKNRKPHFFVFKRYLFSLLIFKALPVDINLWHIKFKFFKIKEINFWYLNFKLQIQGSFFLIIHVIRMFLLKLLLLFYVEVFCTNMCLHSTCVPGACWVRKRESDYLKLKFQMVASYLVSVGHKPGPLEEQPVLLMVIVSVFQMISWKVSCSLLRTECYGVSFLQIF